MPPKVLVSNLQKDISLSISSVRSLVREVLSLKKQQTHEVSVYFVSEKKISFLHKKYFHDPQSTDCITLPLDECSIFDNYHILGEIFVCPLTAKKYVTQNGGDIYEEISLYVIHGLLHLLGYDDLSFKERRRMRYQEQKLLQHLRLKDLFLKCSLSRRI